jgi:hypothetical protein
MRHFAAAFRPAALVLGLTLSASCAQDACAGLDGTCVALTVDGPGQIDGLEIAVSGAATGSQVVPPVAAAHALPVDVAVELAHASSGALHLDVIGVFLGTVVGHGTADLTISAGAHASATVRLTP